MEFRPNAGSFFNHNVSSGQCPAEPGVGSQRLLQADVQMVRERGKIINIFRMFLHCLTPHKTCQLLTVKISGILVFRPAKGGRMFSGVNFLEDYTFFAKKF